MTPKSIQAELIKLLDDSKAGDTLQKHYLFKGYNEGHDTEMYEAEVNDLAEILAKYFLKTAPEMVYLDKEKIYDKLDMVIYRRFGQWNKRMNDDDIRGLAHALSQAKGVVRGKNDPE